LCNDLGLSYFEIKNGSTIKVYPRNEVYSCQVHYNYNIMYFPIHKKRTVSNLYNKVKEWLYQNKVTMESFKLIYHNDNISKDTNKVINQYFNNNYSIWLDVKE
jgi:hypothetical protein